MRFFLTDLWLLLATPLLVGVAVLPTRASAAENEMAMTDTTEISYVMEPFEQIHPDWTIEPALNDTTFQHNFNVTLDTDQALFGERALRLDYDLDSNSTTTTAVGWTLQGRPHNCYGATHLSLWYKNLVAQSVVGAAHLQVSLVLKKDDTHQDEPSTIVKKWEQFDVLDDDSTEWQDIQINLEKQNLDLRQVQGWKVELLGPSMTFTSTSGTLLLDQLACVGGGDLLGAAFHSAVSLEDSITEGTWMDTYYQSNISRQETSASLQQGELAIDYTVQQVETWGGFVDFAHLAPGAAYYNLSKANNLVVQYNIKEPASIPGRTIFRLVLQDASDCGDDCSDTDYHSHERWYNFQAILDGNGKGQVAVPLVGSPEPSTPFWLTGWSGIIGNSELDSTHLKGFTLELVLDSELELGETVSGSVTFSNMAAIIKPTQDEVGGDGLQDDTSGKCVVETDLLLLEHAPHFTRLEFLGNKCCEECQADPDCLYALSTGRDCFVASYLDPDFVGLANTELERKDLTSFWMDDATKRGDFCDKCTCQPEQGLIDCRDRDLVMVPKTFDSSAQGWSPRTLDLRGNPRLAILGSGSLSAITESLEKLLLPQRLRHIGQGALNELPKLQNVQVEGEWNILNNAIMGPSDAFGDVCCSRGDHLDVPSVGPWSHGLTFCDMRVHEPGIDAVYEPFKYYLDANPLKILFPSSSFMAEASESVETCAEYCSVIDECRFFSYDARLPNAEHACHLLVDQGSRKETVCCDEDHYADENQTVAGWTSGLPPRTRHEIDDAAVKRTPQNVVADESNGYKAQYEVSLGSTPLRGAVWITPTVASSTAADLEVSIWPPRVVLYDTDATVTVTVELLNMDSVDSASSGTLVIENVVHSCDTAYTISLTNSEHAVYVDVIVPAEEDSLVAAFVLPFLLLAIIGLTVFLWYERRKKQNDTVWKVNEKELHFADPPEIIGRGTFGQVLLAEYRGTQVAVKRVIPPRGSQKTNKSSKALFHLPDPQEVDAENDKLGTSSWAGMGLNSATGSMMKSVRKSGTFGQKSSMNEAATWRKLKKDFIEEMRQLSKLRHPCVTTVMGAVIGKGVDEPMLVMEYMDHGSLFDLLHNETMVIEGELLLPILRDISLGLRFLHSADPQVIHGDLKAAKLPILA